MEHALHAFRRELPELLLHHDRRWVAYHGDERVGISDSQFDLYDECRRRGYREGEFLVECIIPEVTEIDPDEVYGR
jgi:hypothetical protein